MRSAGWSPVHPLRLYAPTYFKKMGIITVGWLLVYLLSYPFRGDGTFWMLFAPIPGAIAGLVAGWYMATNAVEDSSLQGMLLWVLLVAGAVLPMWVVEGVMHPLTRWPMNFGGFMLLTAASLMAMAAAVWHASTQE